MDYPEKTVPPQGQRPVCPVDFSLSRDDSRRVRPLPKTHDVWALPWLIILFPRDASTVVMSSPQDV